MKKLKIVLCAMLLALSSLMFVACGPSEFNEENITFGQSTFTYDGNAHAFVVSYDVEASFGEEITVEYKLYGENWTTDPITKTEVGSYKVIYRLKANIFETYDSSVEGPATHGNFEIVMPIYMWFILLIINTKNAKFLL